MLLRAGGLYSPRLFDQPALEVVDHDVALAPGPLKWSNPPGRLAAAAGTVSGSPGPLTRRARCATAPARDHGLPLERLHERKDPQPGQRCLVVDRVAAQLVAAVPGLASPVLHHRTRLTTREPEAMTWPRVGVVGSRARQRRSTTRAGGNPGTLLMRYLQIAEPAPPLVC